MPKHIDAVPKIDEFKAPWETETGEDAEIDKGKLKKWIHNLITDKAKAQDARDAETEKVTEITTERDTLKEQVEKADGEDATKKIAKLTRERDEAISKAEAADVRADRAEVIAEAGLTEKQAKYLPITGTKEELEAAAKELIEDFGPAKAADEDEDEDEDDEDGPSGRTTPQIKRNLNNGGDQNNSADQEPDYEKIAAQIAGNSPF